MDLLSNSEHLHCKPINTPSDPSVKINQDIGPRFSDVPSYRRLIGRLLYPTTTRPAITFIVQQLSQFLASPTQVHFKYACRVLSYLKQAPARGLFFPSSSSLHLQGFSDVNWAGCPDTTRYVAGMCFFLGDSLVSWKAKKHASIYRSYGQAEYLALGAATCELQ